MSDRRTPAEKMEAQGYVRGIDFETVGDILERTDGNLGDRQAVTDPAPFVLPRLETYPHPPLQPGLYFGMDEATYLNAPALSNTGIKRLASSPMLYWALTPWLNADFEPPEEKDHFNLGHAYDCRIFDGRDAFFERFALALDKADYPKALFTLDDIKKRLVHLIGDSKGCGASKDSAFEKLLEWEPDAQLWDRLVAAHAKENEGKVMISAVQHRRIEIAARMIENDEEMATIVRDGHSQVSLFWNCPKTQVPMKARADKLLIRSIVDMKSLANQQGRSMEGAIFREIAQRHYNIQPSVYFEGADEVRKLVRAHGASAVFSAELTPGQEMSLEEQERHQERVAWAMKWAKHNKPDEWLWIFQQTGIAPVTRLVHYPRGGVTKTVTDEIVSRMKRRFRQMADTYGTDPWLDLAPRIDLADEDIPNWALEI